MTEEIKKKRNELQVAIQKEYNASQLIKSNILNGVRVLETQIDSLFEKVQRAELDYKNYEQFIKAPIFKMK